MRLMILAFTISLAACGGNAPADESTADPKAPEVIEPKFSEEEDVSSSQVAADPACAEKGVMCAGPLIVRAEGFNLFSEGRAQSDGTRYLKMRGTLVVSNRSGDPVKFAILDQPIAATLDNGAQMQIDHRGVTGMTLCGREGAQCLQGMPDRFQTLASSESPARFTLSFSGRNDGSLAASIPNIAVADVTLQLYAVGGDNAGKTLNIQLPQVPLRNQLKQ